VIFLAALGAGGLVYSSRAGEQTSPAKLPSELEKLRRENELLKVNLRVTLEKIQVLENEVRVLKGRKKANLEALDADLDLQKDLRLDFELQVRDQAARALGEAEKARALEADAARALGREVEKARSRPNKNVVPPGDAPSGQKLNESMDELARALKSLQEMKARQAEVPQSVESLLRRTVDSLDQTLKQLRELEKNRRQK
jgi:hypothetical protein